MFGFLQHIYIYINILYDVAVVCLKGPDACVVACKMLVYKATGVKRC